MEYKMHAMPRPLAESSLNSPAIDYALKGLERCWLPEHGRWSHIHHLDGRIVPNESRPHSDVFYTLNVLLGMTRVPLRPAYVDFADVYHRNAERLLSLPVREYAFGMALWTAGEAGIDVPGSVLDRVRHRLSSVQEWKDLKAQDVGMLLIGAALQCKREGTRWLEFSQELFTYVSDHFCNPSGLFSDGISGLRVRYASFASQVYLTIACYYFGEITGSIRAIDLANTCARRLISLQGPEGEWPWFFDARQGIVVDFYEVYSVHQYGMAPAFLEFAERHGVAEARGALIKGFNWIFGSNQLRVPMLVPDRHLTIRSQVRRGELGRKTWRALRAATNSVLTRGSRLAEPPRVELRLECRSYELGWLLWSFGRRNDLTELTHHRVFLEALARPSGGEPLSPR